LRLRLLEVLVPHEPDEVAAFSARRIRIHPAIQVSARWAFAFPITKQSTLDEMEVRELRTIQAGHFPGFRQVFSLFAPSTSTAPPTGTR
jgi:hypothetical protein